MELYWHGHSCFRLKGKETTVLTDPCPRASGYALGRVTADLVTVSSTHPNHNAVDEVAGSPTIIDGPGEYEVKGVYVTGVRTVPSRAATDMRNTAYIMILDEIRICHLGDLSTLPTAEHIEMMKDIDILLLPVGGHCTIGPTEAIEVISRIEPKLVVPMHYATSDSTAELDGVDRFLHEMGIAQSEPQARINVTHSSLPTEPTVTLLQYRR
ncbi:MAG: Zn-dependent hydrolase of the beta-lactamase fold-like protein [Chloroflexi bacterium]|nr:Zn-dependent hydrolase of the beta-lactamase fold-like protein [Chloroflexota bacterium]